MQEDQTEEPFDHEKDLTLVSWAALTIRVLRRWLYQSVHRTLQRWNPPERSALAERFCENYHGLQYALVARRYRIPFLAGKPY